MTILHTGVGTGEIGPGTGIGPPMGKQLIAIVPSSDTPSNFGEKNLVSKEMTTSGFDGTYGYLAQAAPRLANSDDGLFLRGELGEINSFCHYNG